MRIFSLTARDYSGTRLRRGNRRANNIINGTILAMMAWCSLGQSPLLHQGNLQEFDRLAMQRRALPTSPLRSSCLLDGCLDILILREFDVFQKRMASKFVCFCNSLRNQKSEGKRSELKDKWDLYNIRSDHTAKIQSNTYISIFAPLSTW